MAKKKWLPKGFIKVWKISDESYSLEWGHNTNLIYNLETKIIYYYFNVKGIKSMCPYYGPNGKPCTIEGSKIVEVG